MLCEACGFIYNEAFDEERMNYSASYDGTQSFSPTFNAFHERLAHDLIERYNLRGKDVVEIGCGNGEFLTLLCDLGGNRGVGYDPAYSGPRAPADYLTFVPNVYTKTPAEASVDLVCCKMTLEHIARPAEFLSTIRRGLEGRPDTPVFFQVPDVTRILREGAFWDIYHEHCSYFSPPSLARLFDSQGFSVRRTWTGFDDQYLMIEAHPTNDAGPHPASVAAHRELPSSDVEALLEEVSRFSTAVRTLQAAWSQALQHLQAQSKTVALWGGGSKAVAFLTTLGVDEAVRCAVDINPNKHDTFLAGTGHRIIGPAALSDYAPDVVIIMNSMYRNEIRAALANHNLHPLVLVVEDDPRPHLGM